MEIKYFVGLVLILAVAVLSNNRFIELLKLLRLVPEGKEAAFNQSLSALLALVPLALKLLDVQINVEVDPALNQVLDWVFDFLALPGIQVAVAGLISSLSAALHHWLKQLDAHRKVRGLLAARPKRQYTSNPRVAG